MKVPQDWILPHTLFFPFISNLLSSTSSVYSGIPMTAPSTLMSSRRAKNPIPFNVSKIQACSYSMNSSFIFRILPSLYWTSFFGLESTLYFFLSYLYFLSSQHFIVPIRNLFKSISSSLNLTSANPYCDTCPHPRWVNRKRELDWKWLKCVTCFFRQILIL